MERFFSIVITTILALTIYSPGGAEDQLSDLTGGVIPLVSFDPADALSPGGELYASGELTTRSDLRYSIRVKNQTGDPILASSLIIVVDKIVEVARGRDVTNQLEVRSRWVHRRRETVFSYSSWKFHRIAPFCGRSSGSRANS